MKREKLIQVARPRRSAKCGGTNWGEALQAAGAGLQRKDLGEYCQALLGGGRRCVGGQLAAARGKKTRPYIAVPLDGVENADGPLRLDDAVRQRADGGKVIGWL